MKSTLIHKNAGLVDVFWRDDIQAVHLKWYSEFDTGTAVRDAVGKAIEFVYENSVANWLVDISASDEALSDADYEWVSGDVFRDLICSSPLRWFGMIPPGPGSKQDTGWIAEWEKNTLSNFGSKVAAKVFSDTDEIAAFFDSEPKGEKND